MDDIKKSNFKNIITWPEFRVAWGLFVVIGIAFVIDFLELNHILALIEALLLLTTLIFVIVAIYQSSQKDRDTSIEGNELKSILRSIDDALIVYDGDFKIVFFNTAAEKLFKLSASDVMGHALSPRDVEKEGWRTLAQAIFPSLSPRVVARTKEGEIPQVSDVSLTDPEFEFRISSAPVTDETGRTLAFMKIIRDRTAQIGAVRSKNEFITVASHQLRGPVTDINWALQALAQIPNLDDTNKMIVQTAAAASDNLLRRIEDLLNIAKMEDGQVGYKFEDTDLVEYISKLLADVLPAARKAGIKMYFDRPTEPMPHVMIDPKRLSLAVTNLLENAIRYNVESGDVTVKMDKMQGKPFIVVSVKDTGIGIPPESIAKLFNKFYRADNAMKTQTEGSGLGLYIAKGIINAHGGQIWAESELNRGTTLSFALPTDPKLIPQHEGGSEDFI